MTARENGAKRRRAFDEGLLPAKYAETRGLPDGKAIAAHEPELELETLARVAVGEQSAWDALAVEQLAQKCFGRDCAVADGDMKSCPGWCAVAIAGFEGWVMAS